MKTVTAACLGLFLASYSIFAGAAPRVALSLRGLDQHRTLTPIHHRGDQYIVGQAGQRYAIELRNLTPRRQLVVLSVDGVNAVTGETAAPDQAGYVLEPYQATEVRGWRKSLSDIAEFAFAPLPASYAARTGRPDDVGVVGIAVFEEALPRWREPSPALDKAQPASPPAPAAEAGTARAPAKRNESLGTAHGARRYDPVGRTHFVRASRFPAERQALYYDSHANLVAAGIIPPPWRPDRRRPDPFPLGFVPDP